MRKFCWFFIVVLVLSLSVMGCKEESGSSHKAQNYPSDPAEMDKSAASTMDGGTDVDSPDSLPEYDGPSFPTSNGWSAPTKYTPASDLSSPWDIFVTANQEIFFSDGMRGLYKVDASDPENPSFTKMYYRLEAGGDPIPFRAVSVYGEDFGDGEYLWVSEYPAYTQRELENRLIGQMPNAQPRIYRIKLHETPDPGSGTDVYNMYGDAEAWYYEFDTVPDPYNDSTDCTVEFMHSIAVIAPDNVFVTLNWDNTYCGTDEMFAWLKFQDDEIQLEGSVKPSPSFLQPVDYGIMGLTTTYNMMGQEVEYVDTYATVGSRLYALDTQNITCNVDDVCTMGWEFISDMFSYHNINHESLHTLGGAFFVVGTGGWMNAPSNLTMIGMGFDQSIEIGMANNPFFGLSLFNYSVVLAAFPFESQVIGYDLSESGQVEESEELITGNGLTGVKEIHFAKDYATSEKILIAHDQILFWDHWLEEISGEDGSATGSFMHFLESGYQAPGLFQFAYQNDITKMAYVAKPEMGQILKIPAGTDIDPVTYLDYEMMDYNMVHYGDDDDDDNNPAPSTLEPYAISIDPSQDLLYFGNSFSDPAILTVDLTCEFLPAPGGGECVDYYLKRSDLSGDAYDHFVGLTDIVVKESGATVTGMFITAVGNADGNFEGVGNYIYRSTTANSATLFMEPLDYNDCDAGWTDERVVAWIIRDIDLFDENSIPYLYVTAWPVFGFHNGSECELVYEHGSVVFRFAMDNTTGYPTESDIFLHEMNNAWGLEHEVVIDETDATYDVMYIGDQYENVIYKTQKAWPSAK